MELERYTTFKESALLEAMEEKQVMVDGETRKLKLPFMVLATQKPVESYGTFPLPEAPVILLNTWASTRYFCELANGCLRSNSRCDTACGNLACAAPAQHREARQRVRGVRLFFSVRF